MAIRVQTIEHTGTGAFQLLTDVSGIELDDLKSCKFFHFGVINDSGEYYINSGTLTNGYALSANNTIQFDIQGFEERVDFMTSFKFKGSVTSKFLITLWR